MATYYVDPEGGNDANNGTSFALRRKSFSGTATPVNGDTFRVIASPDAYSIGTGTWTDNNATVTFGALPVVEVDSAGVNWTAAANVTCTLTTSAMTLGANSQLISVASAFVTGKAAYRTLPATLDLSAYDTISFQAASPVTRSSMVLNLCSDSTGDVPLVAINFAQVLGPTGAAGGVANNFAPTVYRHGTALPSNVNSISISFTADPAATSHQIDNIIATTASGGVTHKDLIGKHTVGEPYWYPVVGITATGLSVGSFAGLMTDRPLTNPNYRGVTEAVTTYVQPTLASVSASADRTIGGGGARLSRISGGWDRTNMSTQTGMTYMTPSTGGAASMILGGASTAELDHFGAVGWAAFLFSPAAEFAHDIDFIGMISNDRLNVPSLPAQANWQIRYDVMNRRWIVPKDTSQSFPLLSIDAIHNPGLSSANTGALTFTSTSVQSRERGRRQIRVGAIRYSARYGIQLSGDLDLVGCTFANNTQGDVLFNDATASSGLIGCSANPVVVATGQGTITSGAAGEVWDATHIWRKNVTLTVQSAVPAPISATSLQAAISFSSSYFTSSYPGKVRVGRIVLPVGTHSISAACRKNAGVSAYAAIQVTAYSAPGITTDQTSSAVSATNTWETKTISVTVTAPCAVEVWGLYAGDSGSNLYFGDLTWT